MSAQADAIAYEKYVEFCKRVGATPRSFDHWNANRSWVMNDGTAGPNAWINVDRVRKANEFDED